MKFLLPVLVALAACGGAPGSGGDAPGEGDCLADIFVEIEDRLFCVAAGGSHGDPRLDWSTCSASLPACSEADTVACGECECGGARCCDGDVLADPYIIKDPVECSTCATICVEGEFVCGAKCLALGLACTPEMRRTEGTSACVRAE